MEKISEVLSRRNQHILKYADLIEEFSMISPDVQIYSFSMLPSRIKLIL